MRSILAALTLLAAIGAAQASEVVAVPVGGKWAPLPGRLGIPNETLEEFAARHKRLYDGHWKDRAISATEYWEEDKPIVPIPDDVRAELPEEIRALIEDAPKKQVFTTNVPDAGVFYKTPVTYETEIAGNPWVMNPDNYKFSEPSLRVTGVEPVDENTVKLVVERAVPGGLYEVTIGEPALEAVAPVEFADEPEEE